MGLSVRFAWCGVVLSTALPAGAQEPAAPEWGLTVSGSAVFAVEEAPGTPDASAGSNSLGGALSVDRYLGDVIIGATAGLSSREAVFSADADPVNAWNYSVGGYLSVTTAPVDITAYFDYAWEQYDTDITITADRLPGDIAGPFVFGTSVESRFYNAGLSLAHVFGETTRFVPSLTAGWSRVTTNATIARPGRVDIEFNPNQEASGFNGSGGLAVGHDVSPRVTVYGGGSVSIAENESAVWQSLTTGSLTTRRGRSLSPLDFTTPVSTETDDPVVWAEISSGVSYFVDSSTTVSFDLSGSVGQEQDFVSTGISISRSF